MELTLPFNALTHRQLVPPGGVMDLNEHLMPVVFICQPEPFPEPEIKNETDKD